MWLRCSGDGGVCKGTDSRKPQLKPGDGVTLFIKFRERAVSDVKLLSMTIIFYFKAEAKNQLALILLRTIQKQAPLRHEADMDKYTVIFLLAGFYCCPY